MNRRKQVTPPGRRRKAIVRRLDGHRVEQTYASTTRRDNQNFANGRLIDEAIKRLTLAKKYLAQRDPDWAQSREPVSKIGNNRRARRAASRLVMPGGAVAGYREGVAIDADGEGITKPYWSSGAAPKELYEAAAFVVAELERLQYSDELELGYYDPETERITRDTNTFSIDVPGWAPQPPTVSTSTAGTPFVGYYPATGGITATHTVGSLVFETGDVRIVPQAVPCDSSSQDAQVGGQCSVIGRDTQAQIL